VQYWYVEHHFEPCKHWVFTAFWDWMNWIIYVLKNPRTRAVKYVGKTTQALEARLGQHIAEALKEPHLNRRHRGIMSLQCIGLDPLIEAIDGGTGDGWEQAECAWIASYRAKGAQLWNVAKGGNAVPPGTFEERSERARRRAAGMTPEQRSAISKKGREALTPEQRKNGGRKVQGGKTPEELREWSKRMNAAMTPEFRSSIRTPEERSRHAKKGFAAMSPEALSERVRKGRAAMTPKQRSAIVAKGNATRKAAKVC
jgi:hypothetical protein